MTRQMRAGARWIPWGRIAAALSIAGCGVFMAFVVWRGLSR